MVIAIPNESGPHESRVALVPAMVPLLTRAGHRVLVETRAGTAAGYPDTAYESQGASIETHRRALLDKADAVFMVRGPGCAYSTLADDASLFHKDQLLIGFFNPLMAPRSVEQLARREVIAFAMELMPRISRAQSMDALSSMTNLAGYKAVLLAANALPRIFPLMMTAAGSLAPAKVFVIGAGVTGLQACATAKRLGALVSAYDVRPVVREQVESVGAQFVEFDLPSENTEARNGYAAAQSEDFLRRQQEEMAKVVAASDVVIATAGVPGQRAPVLLTEAMVKGMAPTSVIVDVVADLGGNCALTEPGRTVVKHGVTIIGPENLPATLAHHASQLLSRNIFALFDHLTDMEGRLMLNTSEEITAETLLCRDGRVVHARVGALMD